MPDVAILGAGLAGLYSARLLHSAGVSFTLLEARDRIGGRILTQHGFDLGPSWFWPDMQPALAEVVAELALLSFPQTSAGDVLVERTSDEGPQRFRGYPQSPQSFRMVGGTTALVEAIANALPAGSIRLQAPVASIRLTHGGAEIGMHGQSHVLHARVVIAALPPRLFAHTVAFDPALPTDSARRWRSTPTWMAPHAKFFALYDHAFWHDAGLSGTAQSMVGPMSEIHDATTHSGSAALFGFLGVGADQRAMLGEAQVTEACIAQLSRMFGPEAASPRSTLLKDWAADAYTATPVDRVPGGHPIPDPAPWITGEWAGHLVLGGSEVSSSEPGYLAGAIAAARDATRSALELLRR